MFIKGFDKNLKCRGYQYEIIKSIPNFNPQIFKEITGIDVNDEE